MTASPVPIHEEMTMASPSDLLDAPAPAGRISSGHAAPATADPPTRPAGPPSEYDVTAVVRAALRRWPGEVGPWWIEPVDYDIGSPTTAGLFRVRGYTADGGHTTAWSLFLKVIQSFRHWPLLHILPPDMRERALTETVWRYEADVYASDLASTLPAGLRLPRLHQVDDLGEDRLALWLEDVATVDTPWDLPRFRRAGRLLGRLAARLTRDDCLPPSTVGEHGEGNRVWYTGRVLVAALPALREDVTWAHPLVAASADPRLRADLFELAERVPAMLDALDQLPQTFMHGDASPQNLLVPIDEPDGFVVIDWSMGGLVAVGYDLGQLLIGLAHAGQLDIQLLPAIHDAILGSYTAGLAEEGMPVDEELVRYGFDAALVVRSAFTALPLERLAEPPTDELAEQFAYRARLTRYLVDLGLSLPGMARSRHP